MPRAFKVLERAPEYPFKCIISGLAGPVVDMEKFVEGYGRVYIHTSVIAGMANTLGFMLDTEATELRDQIAAAREAEDRWPAILEEFTNGVVELVDRARVLARNPDAGSGGDVRDPALAGALAVAIRPRADGAAPGAGDGSAVGEDSERAGADANRAQHPDFDQPAVSSD